MWPVCSHYIPARKACQTTPANWYNCLSGTEGHLLDSIDVARKAAEAASDKQASDIMLLDVSGVCSFASYFVICSAESERQLSAIQDAVEEGLRAAKVRPMHREGTIDSGWLLLDYGDVIVHMFSAAEREFYRLEGLWGTAVPVVRIQ